MSVCAVDDDKSAKMVGVGGNAFSSIVAGELMGHVEQLVVCPEETGQLFLKKISALSSQYNTVCDLRLEFPTVTASRNGAARIVWDRDRSIGDGEQ